MSPLPPKTGVVFWFRNDLRLHDQPALQQAIALANQLQTWLLPIYIHDDALRALTPWGFPRTSPAREAWTGMAVNDVARQLAEHGSQLYQWRGPSVEIIQALCQALPTAWLVCEDIAAPFEQAHVQQLKAAGVNIQTVWQSTLMRMSDLPFAVNRVPDQFTTFRQQVERPALKVETPLPVPAQLPALPAHSFLTNQLQQRPNWLDNALAPTAADHMPDPRSAFPFGPGNFDGGETAALAHLQRYCNSTLPRTYKLTRNGLLGVDYSTKWSPWLATGALSARQAWAAVKQHEQLHGANESTYWIGFELLWRDHFRWLHHKYGQWLYRRQGLHAKPSLNQRHSAEAFEAWCTGQTGHDFIDAGMHELSRTAYLSNRMRQNVASYLIHDLGCDWRAGAAWFESQLIDYDVYSNQGNWLYLSGNGTDPRGSRRFNPDKQAKDYDPDKTYRDIWCR